MAVEYFNNKTPAAGVAFNLIAVSASYDYLTSVVCTNKGMGDAKVTIYAMTSGGTEADTMYFAKEQVVPGNSTFETKKLTITGTKALWALSDNGNVSFASVGLRTSRV
jgi:hypothetical protein